MIPVLTKAEALRRISSPEKRLMVEAEWNHVMQIPMEALLTILSARYLNLATDARNVAMYDCMTQWLEAMRDASKPIGDALAVHIANQAKKRVLG